MVAIDSQPHVAIRSVALPSVGSGHAPGVRFLPLAGDKSHWTGHINKAIQIADPQLDEHTDVYIEPYGGGLVYLQNLEPLLKTNKPVLIASSQEFEPDRNLIYTTLKRGDAAALADIQAILNDINHEPQTDAGEALVRVFYTKSKTRIIRKLSPDAAAQLPNLVALLQRPNVKILPWNDVQTFENATAMARNGKRVTLLEDSNYADLYAEGTQDQYKGIDTHPDMFNAGKITDFIGKDPKKLLAQKLPVYRAVLDAGGTVIATNNMNPDLISGLLAEFGDAGHWFGYAHRTRPVPDGFMRHPDGKGVLWSTERPEYLAILRKGVVNPPAGAPKYGTDTSAGLDYRTGPRRLLEEINRAAQPHRAPSPHTGGSLEAAQSIGGPADTGGRSSSAGPVPSRDSQKTPTLDASGKVKWVSIQEAMEAPEPQTDFTAAAKINAELDGARDAADERDRQMMAEAGIDDNEEAMTLDELEAAETERLRQFYRELAEDSDPSDEALPAAQRSPSPSLKVSQSQSLPVSASPRLPVSKSQSLVHPATGQPLPAARRKPAGPTYPGLKKPTLPAPQPRPDLFGEWAASLSNNDLIGFRGEITQGRKNGFGNTEGNGIYLMRDRQEAAVFGTVQRVSFPEPQRPFLVTNDDLYLLQESEDLDQPIDPAKDTPWLQASKYAAQHAHNLGKGKWDAQLAGDVLTKLLMEAGYDSVYVKGMPDDWIVLLRETRPGQKPLKALPAANRRVLPPKPDLDDYPTFKGTQEERRAQWDKWHSDVDAWNERVNQFASRQGDLGTFLAAETTNSRGGVYREARVITRVPGSSTDWRTTIFGQQRITPTSTPVGDWANNAWVPIAHDEFPTKGEAYQSAVRGMPEDYTFSSKPLFAANRRTLDSVIAENPEAQELTNLDLLVHRVGPLNDPTKGRGLFFGDSLQSINGYLTSHPGHEPKVYQVTTKKTFIARSVHDLWRKLFNKPLDLNDIDIRRKLKSTVLAGRWAEAQIGKRLRARGFDSYILTTPAAPAKHELALIGKTAVVTPLPAAQRSQFIRITPQMRSAVEAGQALFASGRTPILTASRDVTTLRAAKDAWTAAGFPRDMADDIVDRFYKPAAFTDIPANAVLLPMPSTSGRNILPAVLAQRIAEQQGATVEMGRVATATARTEAKKKTSFWAKMEDPVGYMPGPAFDSLRRATGPIYLVEDVHNTGESWMAMRRLLEDHGIPVAGVATLTATELRVTSPRDIERLSEKIATLTDTPLDEATELVHGLFHDSYKQWFNKAERSATGDARQAVRLLDAARAHARTRPAQRPDEPANEGRVQGQGNQDFVAPSYEQLSLFSASRLAESAVQGYLDLPNVAVPAAKQPTAKRAIRAAAASTARYDLPASRGDVDRSRRLDTLRERAQRTWRGLMNQDVDALKEAFTEKDSFSTLLHDFISREIPSFDIRGAIIGSPADFAAFNLAVRTPYFESLKIAILDAANQVVHSQVVHVGGLNEATVDPKVIAGIIATARMLNPKAKLTGWMIAHNHPSGDPSPSDADRRVTRRLLAMGENLGLPLIDHVVTNGERYFSFREAGMVFSSIDDSIDQRPTRSSKPKLPVLPTPNAPFQDNLADWEAMPSGAFKTSLFVNNPDKTTPYLQALRTADPDHYHVLYLDTRLALRAVERIPTNLTLPQLFQRIVLGAAREGAYAFTLGFPATQDSSNVVQETQFTGPSQQQHIVVRRLREQSKDVGLIFADAMTHSQDRHFSFSEHGLMEKPGALASAPRRARQSMTFDPPFQAPFGDILRYEWTSKPVGGMDSQRISDWDNSVTNGQTGRAIVHLFKVRKPDGIHTVSLETAMGLLSDTQRRSLNALIRSHHQRQQEERTGQMALFSAQRLPILEAIDRIQDYHAAEDPTDSLDYLPDDLQAKIKADPRYQWLQNNSIDVGTADWFPAPYGEASRDLAKLHALDDKGELTEAQNTRLSRLMDILIGWEESGGALNHILETYHSEIDDRLKDTITQIEATGRWTWDEETNTFDATDEDSTQVLFAAHRQFAPAIRFEGRVTSAPGGMHYDALVEQVRRTKLPSWQREQDDSRRLAIRWIRENPNAIEKDYTEGFMTPEGFKNRFESLTLARKLGYQGGNDAYGLTSADIQPPSYQGEIGLLAASDRTYSNAIDATGIQPAIKVNGLTYTGHRGMWHPEIIGHYVWKNIFTPQQRRDDPAPHFKASKFALEEWMDAPGSGFDDFGFIDLPTGDFVDREEAYRRLVARGVPIPPESYTARYQQLDSADILNIAAALPASPRLQVSKSPSLATQVAAAAARTNTNATPAQREAENYETGKVTVHGLRLSIENPAGSKRSGTDANGKPWSVTMPHHYGRILGTVGRDKDHLDFFLGPNPDSQLVLIVNQRKTGNGHFDEHKLMLGFNTPAEAARGYMASYTKGWKGLGSAVPTTIPVLKHWITTHDTTQPVTKEQLEKLAKTVPLPTSAHDKPAVSIDTKPRSTPSSYEERLAAANRKVEKYKAAGGTGKWIVMADLGRWIDWNKYPTLDALRAAAGIDFEATRALGTPFADALPYVSSVLKDPAQQGNPALRELRRQHGNDPQTLANMLLPKVQEQHKAVTEANADYLSGAHADDPFFQSAMLRATMSDLTKSSIAFPVTLYPVAVAETRAAWDRGELHSLPNMLERYQQHAKAAAEIALRTLNSAKAVEGLEGGEWVTLPQIPSYDRTEALRITRKYLNRPSMTMPVNADILAERGATPEELAVVRRGETESSKSEQEAIFATWEALSHPNWCTSRGMARTYAKQGKMVVYRKNSTSLLAIRFNGEDVVEVQSASNNGTIPIEYLPEVENYAKSASERTRVTLAQVRERSEKEADRLRRIAEERARFLASLPVAPAPGATWDQYGLIELADGTHAAASDAVLRNAYQQNPRKAALLAYSNTSNGLRSPDGRFSGLKFVDDDNGLEMRSDDEYPSLETVRGVVVLQRLDQVPALTNVIDGVVYFDKEHYADLLPNRFIDIDDILGYPTKFYPSETPDWRQRIAELESLVNEAQLDPSIIQHLAGLRLKPRMSQWNIEQELPLYHRLKEFVPQYNFMPSSAHTLAGTLAAEVSGSEAEHRDLVDDYMSYSPEARRPGRRSPQAKLVHDYQESMKNHPRVGNPSLYLVGHRHRTAWTHPPADPAAIPRPECGVRCPPAPRRQLASHG
jgi:DNA repair protein RadC